MEWKPIETAPKDGTHVLCYDPSHDEAKVYVVKYEPALKSFYNSCNRPERWIEASGEGYFLWEPTHWMELPSEPKET